MIIVSPDYHRYRNPADPFGVRADKLRGRFPLLRDGVLVDSFGSMAGAMEYAAEIRRPGEVWEVCDKAEPTTESGDAIWTVVP